VPTPPKEGGAEGWVGGGGQPSAGGHTRHPAQEPTTHPAPAIPSHTHQPPLRTSRWSGGRRTHTHTQYAPHAMTHTTTTHLQTMQHLGRRRAHTHTTGRTNTHPPCTSPPPLPPPLPFPLAKRTRHCVCCKGTTKRASGGERRGVYGAGGQWETAPVAGHASRVAAIYRRFMVQRSTEDTRARGSSSSSSSSPSPRASLGGRGSSSPSFRPPIASSTSCRPDTSPDITN